MQIQLLICSSISTWKEDSDEGPQALERMPLRAHEA